jgi:thiol-disulfide isomerase/thioredoxin
MKQPQTKKKLRKSILSFLTLISLQGMVSALDVGDEVSAKAVGKAEFIQGSAPEKWEKGKVYVLECWATWCAPCIAAIPHVDGLYDKYRDQGLVMIGMNVFEDGRDKVVKFVDEKSEGMSYPVAYVGRGGAFENEWLKPAGVKGIPHAFVVKDGRLLFKTHPMKLTSQMIETLLEGGEAESKLLARMKSAEENKGTLQQNLMAFKNAKNASDAAAMETAMAGVRNLNPDDSNLAPMAIELKLVKKQWLELKDQ